MREIAPLKGGTACVWGSRLKAELHARRENFWRNKAEQSGTVEMAESFGVFGLKCWKWPKVGEGFPGIRLWLWPVEKEDRPARAARGFQAVNVVLFLNVRSSSMRCWFVGKRWRQGAKGGSFFVGSSGPVQPEANCQQSILRHPGFLSESATRSWHNLFVGSTLASSEFIWNSRR